MKDKSLLPLIALAMLYPQLAQRRPLNTETIAEKEKQATGGIDLEEEMELIRQKRSSLSPEMRRVVKRRYKAMKKEEAL